MVRFAKNKMNCNLHENEDRFKQIFKYYKCNKPKPSYCNVLKLDGSSIMPLLQNSLVKGLPVRNIEDARSKVLGLQELKEWKTYGFQKHPGLIFIRNPFTNLGQRYWIRRCLEEYPRKPNITNLDIEINLQDWWLECHSNVPCNTQLLKKLRWTTLGYHHNWDTKVYSEENRNTFPEDLAELTDVVARYLDYDNFRAEAAIVNYYHMDSTLSPHTDHSEVNLEAPLFSFSFGQSAVFLLGGTDKTVEPSAILLNSGDIVVMSKEARLCYHAVPRILPAASEPWEHLSKVPFVGSELSYFKYITNGNEMVSLVNRNADSAEWNKFGKYVNESRININVRQVLNNSQKNLKDIQFNVI